PHDEKGIEWVVASQRADLLHVIGTASDDRAVLEQASERLKIADAIIAELIHQRARVQIEPRRLQVSDDAEFRQFLHGFAAHKVAMRNTGTRLGNWHLLAQFFIHAKQRMNCAVAERMGGELEA